MPPTRRECAAYISGSNTFFARCGARAAAVPSTDLIGGFAVALTIAFAGYQTMHGQLTLGKFASFLPAMLLAQQPVRDAEPVLDDFDRGPLRRQPHLRR